MPHSVPLVKPRNAKEIDEFALGLVAAFQPGALRTVTKFDVERFFDCELEGQTGVEPVYQSLGEGLDGYTDSAEMKCVISSELANHGNDDVQRRRLRATLAHEIGHCFLHVEDSLRARTMLKFLHDENAALELYKQEEINAYENPEWQAWRFAGALLMPKDCIRLAVDNDWSVQMMSRGFDVNPAFVKVRLDALKITKSIRGR
jgi:hypothetical protein